MNKDNAIASKKVLDVGVVALLDVMGDDQAICDAARISYGKGTKKISNNRNLIRYLMRHRHTSPFEMVECKFFIRIPMDAWRQMIRHRTANVNEYSTRYSEAIEDFYLVDKDGWRRQSTDNKQGSGAAFSDILGEGFCQTEQTAYAQANYTYRSLLRAGIAREQARKVLPLSTYTEAYWKIDLHNLLHFLKLRMDAHAQYEIRQYAEAIAELIAPIVPLTYEAWEDYVLHAVTFSRQELAALKTLVRNQLTPLDELSLREQREFKQKLGLDERVDE